MRLSPRKEAEDLMIRELPLDNFMKQFKTDQKADASPKARVNEKRARSPLWNKIEDSHHVEFAVNDEPSLIREHIHSLIEEYRRKRGSQLSVKKAEKSWYDKASAQEKYIDQLSN